MTKTSEAEALAGALADALASATELEAGARAGTALTKVAARARAAMAYCILKVVDFRLVFKSVLSTYVQKKRILNRW